MSLVTLSVDGRPGIDAASDRESHLRVATDYRAVAVVGI